METCVKFEDLETENQDLIRNANQVKDRAYAPYSRFHVGAAILLCNDDHIYTGCNVENASFGLTNCAERTALFKGVSEATRNRIRVRKLAIIANGGEFTTPCGACLQVLSEFGDQFDVYISNPDMSQVFVTNFGALFPKPPFPNKNLLIG